MDSSDFIKLSIRHFPARDLRETPEGRYWKRFRSPLTAAQIGAVSSVEFCDEYPHHLAVTSSTRVIVYDGATGGLLRRFSRFKDKAYGGTFRSDGKLLAAGGESSIVQVFDANSRALLRQLPGHSRPVHTVKFASDRLHLFSGGDDATVRWWDLTTGEQTLRLDGHGDYVRAAACNPSNNDVWATGSYDHVCKLWDVRSGDSNMAMDHGAPIESLAFFPSGSILVTAGGNYLSVWDIFSGGRLLQRLRTHQKTVTSVLVHQVPESNSFSQGPRMLSASLDGHFKVYNATNFQVTYSAKYPSPILSLGLAPDSKMLAVGMADGTLSLRQNTKDYVSPVLSSRRSRYLPKLKAASFKYFIRGQSTRASADAYVVAARRRANLKTYDRMLRQFQYAEALTAALETKRPEIVASMIDELTTRGGLAAALNGRGAAGILPLVEHLRKHAADPRYTQHIVAVAHQLLDMYAGVVGVGSDESEEDQGVSESGQVLMKKLEQLQEKVTLELRTQEQLLYIKGMLDTLCVGQV